MTAFLDCFPSLEQAIDRRLCQISPDAWVVDALRQMQQCQSLQHTNPQHAPARTIAPAASLPDVLVVEDGRLLGVLSQLDVVRLGAEGRSLSRVTVAEVMRPPLATLRQCDRVTLWTALELLLQHPMQHLPVLDSQDRLIGAIARSSLRQELAIAHLLDQRRVEEAMTTAPEAPDTATLQQVANLMLQPQVEAVVLMAAGSGAADSAPVPIGLLTAADLMRLQALDLDFTTTAATAAIAAPPLCLRPADSLWTALGQMQQAAAIVACEGERLRVLTQARIWEAIDPVCLYETVQELQQRLSLTAAPAPSDYQHLTDELRESRARFQTLIKNMPGMAYRYYPFAQEGGAFRYVSAGAEMLTGLSPAAILADANALWSLIHPDDLPSLQESVAAAVAASALWQWEGRLITPSGQLKWIQGRSQPESTDAGLVWDGLLMDITDRKQLELALQQSEASVNDLLDNAIASICRIQIHSDGRVVPECLSAGAEAVFGFSRTEFLDRPLLWQERVAPEDLATIVQAAWHQATTHGTSSMEYRFRHKDGELRWIKAEMHARPNAEIQGWTLVAVDVDITDRKRLEEHLRQYEQIVSATPDLMSIVDRNYTYQLANRCFLHATQTQLDQIVGRSIGDVLGEEFFTTVVQPRFDRCLSGETVQFELWYDYPELGRQYASVTYTPYAEPDGSISKVIICSRLITELKRLELALQASEARLNDILTTAPASILSAHLYPDRTWHTQYQSLNCGLVFGYMPEEFIEVNWADRTHPADVERIYAQKMAAALQQECTTLEYRFRGKDEVWRWVSETLSFRWNAAGNYWIVTAVAVNITSLKQAETALQQSEQRLRAILTAIPDIMSLIRRDGVYLEIVRANQAIDLIPAHIDPVGKNSFEMLPAPIAARELQSVQQAIDTQTLQIYEQQVQIGDRTQYEEVRVVPCGEDVALSIVRDITDRRLTELALQASEAKLSAVLERANVALISFRAFSEAELEYIYFSPGVQAIYGYSAEEFIADKRLWLSRVMPEDWQTMIEPLYRQSLEGKLVTVEFRFRQKDGSVVWLRETLVPQRDEERHCWIIAIVATNITDRKLAEERIEQQAQREQALNRVVQAIRQSLDLNTIFQTAVTEVGALIQTKQVGIWKYVPACGVWSLIEIHALDPASVSLRGLEISEHNNPLSDQLKQFQVVQIDDTSTLQDELNLNVAQQFPGAWLLVPFRVERQVWGCLALVKLHPSPWAAFEVELAQAVADQLAIAIYQANLYQQLQTELAERRQVEAALRSSVVRFQTIFTDAPIGIALVAQNCQIAQANRALCQMLGYTEAELKTRTTNDITHPDDRQLVLQLSEQLFSQTIPHYQLEKRLMRRTGEAIWVRSTAGLLHAPSSSTRYKLMMFEDITERRAVDQMKDSFVSIVSHELRTPLAAIRGSLGLFETGLLGTLTPDGQELLSIATAESARLERLVSDILDLERLKSGHVSLLKSQCLAADLVSRSLNSVRSRAAEAGVHLESAVGSETVWADSDRIIQTLTNLLENAIKFSPAAATVTIQVEAIALGALLRQENLTDNQWHQVQYAPQYPSPQLLTAEFSALPHPAAAYALFSVSDRGRGIPSHKLPTIFEPFEQVDSTDASQRKGSGLGLAICRSIIRQHGGEIWVSSRWGQGSRFCFVLPQSPPNTDSRPLDNLL